MLSVETYVPRLLRAAAAASLHQSLTFIIFSFADDHCNASSEAAMREPTAMSPLALLPFAACVDGR
jgi:hypothetical protein